VTEHGRDGGATPLAAYLWAGIAVLMWSTVATAFELTLEHLDPLGMLAFSSLASTLVLLAVVVARGRLADLFGWSARQWGLSVLMGLVNPVCYYLVLFEAYDRLPAQQAQPLNYTWPIALSLLSVPLLGQKVGWRSVVALVVCLVGVVVISTRGDFTTLEFESPSGIVLAVGSSGLWAMYWILNMRDGRDPVARLLSSFLPGTAVVFALWLVLSDRTMPGWQGLVGCAWVGLFEMGLTFVVWLRALTLARSAAQVGVLVYLSPFLSLIAIRFVLGEEILPATVAGLVLIVAGIVTEKWTEIRTGLAGGGPSAS